MCIWFLCKYQESPWSVSVWPMAWQWWSHAHAVLRLFPEYRSDLLRLSLHEYNCRSCSGHHQSHQQPSFSHSGCCWFLWWSGSRHLPHRLQVHSVCTHRLCAYCEAHAVRGRNICIPWPIQTETIHTECKSFLAPGTYPPSSEAISALSQQRYPEYMLKPHTSFPVLPHSSRDWNTAGAARKWPM